MNITTAESHSKVRKSEYLTKEDKRALKAFIKNFRFDSHAAEEMGISRAVLCNVMAKGSGAPQTLAKIRSTIYASA